MARTRKPSSSTLKILNCFSASPGGLHGYALMKASGLASGTLYPILGRLSDRGWLEKAWETGDDISGPPRRIYTLTAVGRVQLEGLTETDDLPAVKARTAP